MVFNVIRNHELSQAGSINYQHQQTKHSSQTAFGKAPSEGNQTDYKNIYDSIYENLKFLAANKNQKECLHPRGEAGGTTR